MKEKKEVEIDSSWQDTYGDMVTLLLCFFVMMVAGASATLTQQFGWPTWTGAALLAGCACISTIFGLDAVVDVIGKIMGFEQATIDAVIQDFQVRLYAVYKGVQENADQSALVYWESNSGNAVSSSMAISYLSVLGAVPCQATLFSM